jgi:hypothetical protein
MKDYVSFGVFGAENEILYSAKHRIDSGQNELSFVVDKKPEKAGIDPRYLLIDKNTDNNIVHVAKGRP